MVPFPCFCWNCWLASRSRWSATFRGTVGLLFSETQAQTQTADPSLPIPQIQSLADPSNRQKKGKRPKQPSHVPWKEKQPCRKTPSIRSQTGSDIARAETHASTRKGEGQRSNRQRHSWKQQTVSKRKCMQVRDRTRECERNVLPFFNSGRV